MNFAMTNSKSVSKYTHDFNSVVNHSYLVTIRTADSIPIPVVNQLKGDYQYRISIIEKELPDVKDQLIPLEKKKYFGKFDHQLDKRIQANDLFFHERAIQILRDAIHLKDGDWYDVHAYSILPNHTHLLIDINKQNEMGEEQKDISSIISHIKKVTNAQIQKELGITNSIWQKENYYHKTPNIKEWMNIASYILTNPVKADLVKNWDKWEYSYLKP